MVEAHRLYRGQDSSNFRVGSSPETYSAKIVFLFSSCFCCVCLQAFEWLCPEEVEGLSDVVSPRLQRLLQFARTVPGEMKEGRRQLYNVFAWKRSRIRGSEGRCSPIQMRQKIQESYYLFTNFKKVSRILLPTVSSQSSKLNQYVSAGTGDTGCRNLCFLLNIIEVNETFLLVLCSSMAFQKSWSSFLKK